jgi:thioredoxin reductase (NADPH)
MSDELLIAGAGPAGVSAALWAHTFGITTRVLERAAQPGGQLHLVHFHPAELPGIAYGTGPEIAATYAAQLEVTGFALECGAEAVGIEADDRAVTVITAAGVRHEARALLVATGLRRRRLGVPGEIEFAGRGVSYSARLDRERLAGLDVVVVGGGDGAFENALLLTEIGCRVSLVVRGRTRARPEFRARVASDPRIEVLEDAPVLAFAGDTRLERVRIVHAGRVMELPARGVVIKIGMTPNTEWCSALERDADGNVVVDERGRTSRARVWAAGDVARPLLPSIAVAVGSAACAMADLRRTLRGA